MAHRGDAPTPVMAGLDPAIHLLLRKMMDPRVKPEGDG
jgi:hypothetical protein